MTRYSAPLALLIHGLLACSDGSLDSSQGTLRGQQGTPVPRSTIDPSDPREVAAPRAPTAPRVVSGNPSSCAAVIPEAGGMVTFKVDPAKSGTYTSPDGVLTVRIVASEKTFSFTSDGPVGWVIVKGGPGANIYTFAPPVAAAASLVAPRNAGLSHLDFCYPPPGTDGGGGTGGAPGEAGSGGSAAGRAGAGGNSAGGSAGGNSTGGSGESGPCPPEFQVWLATEGQSLCTPIPNDGECPNGYVLDTASEGQFCIPTLPR